MKVIVLFLVSCFAGFFYKIVILLFVGCVMSEVVVMVGGGKWVACICVGVGLAWVCWWKEESVLCDR